jgi:hypothetical protein
LAAVAAVAAVSAPAPTSAQLTGVALLADAAHPGVIGLHVKAPPDQAVTLGEIVDGKRHPLETLSSPVEYWDVAEIAEWRCDRQVRRFYATAQLATGEVVTETSAVRTPSCRERLALRLPTATRPGGLAKFVVRDTWGIGRVAGRLCLAAPGEALQCHRFRIRGGRRTTEPRVRLGPTGRWQVELRGPDQRLRRTLGVGLRASPQRPDLRVPRLLFTGDSMMANLDTIVGDRLGGRARVNSELYFATGLSKPGFDWIQAARRDGQSHHPSAVVVFIGAVEGFSMRNRSGGSIPCCGQDWVAEYARRVSAVVRGYAYGRRTRVFWLTQPAPRDADRAQVYQAVNNALSLATRSSPRLRLVDVAELLTPGFVYRMFMEVDGRRIRVRARDGLHLSLAGARLASTLVMRALFDARIVPESQR